MRRTGVSISLRSKQKMDSLGVNHAASEFNLLSISKNKKNDYRIVPSKKNNCEESASDYDPDESEESETEESDSSIGDEDELSGMVNISSRSKVESLILVNFRMCFHLISNSQILVDRCASCFSY